MINEPTCVTDNTKTLIDSVITYNTDYLTHHGVLATSITDHDLIFALRKINYHRGSPRFIETRNFKNFNEQKFIQDIQNTNWPMSCQCQNFPMKVSMLGRIGRQRCRLF